MAIFKSRKFVTMIVAIVASLLARYLGLDEAQTVEIQQSILVLAGLVIGGTALEDAALKFKSGKPSAPPKETK